MDYGQSGEQSPVTLTVFDDEELELLDDLDFLVDDEPIDEYTPDRDELARDFGLALSPGLSLYDEG